VVTDILECVAGYGPVCSTERQPVCELLILVMICFDSHVTTDCNLRLDSLVIGGANAHWMLDT
jgi:hypothetical protein